MEEPRQEGKELMQKQEQDDIVIVEMEPSNGSKGWKIAIRIMLLCICLGVGVFGGISLYVASALNPVESSDQEVLLAIPKGTGTKEIAEMLEKQGLIRSGLIFHFYLRYTDEGNLFQAGEYSMNPGITIDRIIAKLNQGDTIKEETIHFTIPEGYTLLQIADKLNEQGLVKQPEFVKAAMHFNELSDDPMIEIPENPQLKFRLEGYLFPETYEMNKQSTVNDIISRLVLELKNKLDLLPENWQDQLQALGITFHEMLTVASLIEREVVIDKERPLVAGVIYNRLKQEMNLQIDATVQYIFEQQKERLLYEDLKIESPYNTYLHPGLPPGPIASPSLQSIQAALYPETTKYLFYVTKKDGSHEHLFAETFARHQRNIEESNQQNDNAEQRTEHGIEVTTE